MKFFALILLLASTAVAESQQTSSASLYPEKVYLHYQSKAKMENLSFAIKGLYEEESNDEIRKLFSRARSESELANLWLTLNTRVTQGESLTIDLPEIQTLHKYSEAGSEAAKVLLARFSLLHMQDSQSRALVKDFFIPLPKHKNPILWELRACYFLKYHNHQSFRGNYYQGSPLKVLEKKSGLIQARHIYFEHSKLLTKKAIQQGILSLHKALQYGSKDAAFYLAVFYRHYHITPPNYDPNKYNEILSHDYYKYYLSLIKKDNKAFTERARHHSVFLYE